MKKKNKHIECSRIIRRQNKKEEHRLNIEPLVFENKAGMLPCCFDMILCLPDTIFLGLNSGGLNCLTKHPVQAVALARRILFSGPYQNFVISGKLTTHLTVLFFVIYVFI